MCFLNLFFSQRRGGEVPREIQNVHTIDKLSRDEIVARLSELRKAHSYAFEGEYKRIEDGKNREDTINNIETKSTQEDILSEDRK